ncbi:MAG: Gfo/Idh/MocA family oxidoreductase [Clostridia bacterium]
MKKQLRVAILGQGRSGWKIHGKNFLLQPHLFHTVAVVDPLENRRKAAAARYGDDVDTYADYRELLQRKDIDMVVNATPSHLHVEITKHLLEAGFNVLCDKPVAKNASELNLLIDTARENGCVFTVFQQSRFAAYFTEIQRILASGVLGRPVQISISFSGYSRRWDWQTIQSYNGGSLLNTGPHPLDQALVLFGEGMPDVRCYMDRVNTFGDAEDYVKLILSGKEKPVIDIEISSCQAFSPFTYSIQGSKGGLKGTMDHIDYKYFIEEELTPQKLIREPLEDEDGEPGYCSETINWHEGTWDYKQEEYGTFADMTGKFYEMLYEHIVNDGPLLVSPDQVVRQMAVIEECHRQNPLDRFV